MQETGDFEVRNVKNDEDEQADFINQRVSASQMNVLKFLYIIVKPRRMTGQVNDVMSVHIYIYINEWCISSSRYPWKWKVIIYDIRSPSDGWSRSSVSIQDQLSPSKRWSDRRSLVKSPTKVWKEKRWEKIPSLEFKSVWKENQSFSFFTWTNWKWWIKSTIVIQCGNSSTRQLIFNIYICIEFRINISYYYNW